MVKINIKTLQRNIYSYEVEPSTTIASIKELLQKDHSFTVESQKLIYAGKILVDSSSINDCNLKENDFIVLMVSKPTTGTKEKAPEKPAIPTGSSSPTKASTAAPVTNKPPVVRPVVPATSPVVNSQSVVSGGAEYDATVANLMELGYERDQVVRALKASFNNPDRAVDYLMSGNIPSAEAAAQQFGEEGDEEDDEGAAISPDELAALQNDPQISQMRQLIQQNPQLLEPLLQNLAAAQPQLIQALQQNPELLMQLLGGGGQPGVGGAAPQAGNGGQVVQVTAEENASIERLIGLGFERSRAIEAFLICDKNESLAANYLFDHMNDEEF